METTSTFSPFELSVALVAAAGLEVGLYLLFAANVQLKTMRGDEEPPPKEVAIAVMPVVDDVPLLKLGSKVKPKLPDIWQKPSPKKRYEDKSAPAPDAKKELEELPENEVAKSEETPAPEDAELAKTVDEDIPEEEEKKDDPNLAEEGAADGVKEGTETDPLKAFVVSQYRMKLIAWFKAGFSPPSDQIDCATLAGLLTRATAQVGGDRNVVSFNIHGPSGNAAFDARVKAHMNRKVGQQLPPPPPNYPDILGSVVDLKFSGKTPQCKDSKLPTTAPKTEAPETPDHAPETPPPTPEPAPEPPAEPEE